MLLFSAQQSASVSCQPLTPQPPPPPSSATTVSSDEAYVVTVRLIGADDAEVSLVSSRLKAAANDGALYDELRGGGLDVVPGSFRIVRARSAPSKGPLNLSSGGYRAPWREVVRTC